MTRTKNPDYLEQEELTVGDLMSEGDKMAVRLLTSESVPSNITPGDRSLSSIFECLSNPERRYVLTYLLCAEGSVTISELVDYAIIQSNIQRDAPRMRKQISVELTQTHLPELEEQGFINYHVESQRITPTEKLGLVEPYIKLALAQKKQIHDTYD